MSYTKGNWKKGWGNGLTGPTTITASVVCAGGKDWKYEPISNGYETIGIAVMQENLSTTELEANAKLMAAAPDLLEACQQLFFAPHQEHFITRLNDEEMKGMNMIKAAIEKAVNG